MSRILLLVFLSLCYTHSFGQVSGVINDGASIYMSGGAKIYINGSGGNYTNQNSGQITAGASDSIILGGNWMNNTSSPVFTSNGGTVVLAGAAQTLGGTNSTSFNNLVLNGTGTASLANDILVGGGYTSPSGTLNIASQALDLAGHTLTISNPASGSSTTGAVQYSTGYIISEQDSSDNHSQITWQMGGTYNAGDHIFPFGTADGVQIPVNFSILTSSNTNITVSTRRTFDNCTGSSVPGSCKQPWPAGVTNMNGANGTDVSASSIINRWWQIDASAPVSANLALTYQGAENGTNNPTGSFSAEEWGGSNWYAANSGGTGVTSGTGTVYAVDVDQFGPIVLGESGFSLPISLASFTSNCLTHGTELSWTTETEDATDYFTIERSFDGENFSSIGNIKAAGNSSSLREYNFLDSTSYSTVAYYRLKETEANGQANIFNVIVADCHTLTPFAFAIYPNPNPGNYLNVHLSGLTANANVQMKIVDILGRQIAPTTNDIADGTGILISGVDFNHNLPKGIYNLVVQTNDAFMTKSFVIQ